MDDRGRLDALAPVAARLLDRHLSMAKEWFPHELVPWHVGRSFEQGEEWNPDDFPLPDAVRSALIVNVLTEDNLPCYFHAMQTLYETSEVWSDWNHRWTAEEHRHSIVLRDWLTVTRAVDPIRLERARMAQVSSGFGGASRGVVDGLVYVTLQELATRIAHRNTGRLVGDGPAERIAARVAADENLHYLFYRDLGAALAEIDPSGLVVAAAAEVRGFEMPGRGIPGFSAHAAAIAGAGIYDFAIHYEQVLVPVLLRSWRIDSMVGLDPAAERARDDLFAYLDRLDRVAVRQSEQRLAAVPDDRGPLLQRLPD